MAGLRAGRRRARGLRRASHRYHLPTGAPQLFGSGFSGGLTRQRSDFSRMLRILARPQFNRGAGLGSDLEGIPRTRFFQRPYLSSRPIGSVQVKRVFFLMLRYIKMKNNSCEEQIQRESKTTGIQTQQKYLEINPACFFCASKISSENSF